MKYVISALAVLGLWFAFLRLTAKQLPRCPMCGTRHRIGGPHGRAE